MDRRVTPEDVLKDYVWALIVANAEMKADLLNRPVPPPDEPTPAP